MMSRDIEQILGLEFHGWRKWQDPTEGLPDALGVYVIGTANEKPISRLKGESDVVYIGQGKIKRRIISHKTVRPDLRDVAGTWP